MLTDLRLLGAVRKDRPDDGGGLGGRIDQRAGDMQLEAKSPLGDLAVEFGQIIGGYGHFGQATPFGYATVAFRGKTLHKDEVVGVAEMNRLTPKAQAHHILGGEFAGVDTVGDKGLLAPRRALDDDDLVPFGVSDGFLIGIYLSAAEILLHLQHRLGPFVKAFKDRIIPRLVDHNGAELGCEFINKGCFTGTDVAFHDDYKSSLHGANVIRSSKNGLGCGEKVTQPILLLFCAEIILYFPSGRVDPLNALLTATTNLSVLISYPCPTFTMLR